MKKYIIWFTPTDKQVTFNQFHVFAFTLEEAIQLFYNNANFQFKIMGISGYDKVGANNNEFINQKFY